jgi:hypothetical protein
MPEELNSKNTTSKTPSFTERHHGHLGPMLGALILLVVIILGGLYLWGQSLSKNDPAFQERVIPNNEPETPRAIVDAQILETLSPSDDLGAIEADLNSTNLDSIDADMTTIDAELESTLPQ